MTFDKTKIYIYVTRDSCPYILAGHCGRLGLGFAFYSLGDTYTRWRSNDDIEYLFEEIQEDSTKGELFKFDSCIKALEFFIMKRREFDRNLERDPTIMCTELTNKEWRDRMKEGE